MHVPPECFAEGAIALRAVLSSGSREVFELFYTEAKPARRASSPGEREVLIELCRARGIPTKLVSEEFLCERAQGRTHGGLLARVGEKELTTPEALVASPSPFLAYLSGIEDPYNFAACLRTLYAAGCDGVFLPERNWMSAGSVILRSSAGASEHLPMATVLQTAEDFLTLLKSHGITPVSAREERAENLYHSRLSRPLCLIIGGERRGVDKSLDRLVEQGVVIPYGRGYQRSLSAQAACAVISFEILRQTQEVDPK